MTSAAPLSGWYPLMRADALRGKPQERYFAGRPVRLARKADGSVSAAGLTGTDGFPVSETGGWIFVASGGVPEAGLIDTRLLDGACSQLRTEGFVQAALGDVGENILDTTHTSVVHQDYLRRPGNRRMVEAAIASGENWVSATYPAGAAPGGWGARLLGAHKYTICDTFRAPAIAEVVYTENKAPVFAARFHLVPARPGQTFVAATIAVPGRGAFAAMKLAALRVFFVRIFAEDRAILELIATNREAHRGAPIIFTPQDILRPGIEAILSGRRPLEPVPHAMLMV